MFPEFAMPEIRRMRREVSMPNVKPIKKANSATDNFESNHSKFAYEPLEEKKLRSSKSFVTTKLKIHPYHKKQTVSLVSSSQPCLFKSPPCLFELTQSSQVSPILPKTIKPNLASLVPKQEGDLKNFNTKSFPNNENTNFQTFYNKEVPEDPFYYGNIIKNSNFSAFRSLFDGSSDINTLSYPIKWKKGKVIVKPKPCKNSTKIARLNRVLNCKCPNFAKKESIVQATQADIKESLPSLREVKKTIQTLYRVHFFPQKAQCFKNLILVNFDGTLGYFKNSFSKKKGTWKLLQKLSTYFQIVLIIHNKMLKDIILQVIESKKIIISGIYCVNDNPNVLKRCRNFLDYSQIYYDFEVSTPNHNCLVITCHNLSENPENPEEMIFDYGRRFTHLLVAGIPVASSEFTETPFVMIVNNIELEKDCSVFQSFVVDLVQFFVDFRCFRDSFDFARFFYKLGYNICKTFKAHHLFLDFVDGHLLDKDYTKEENKSRKVVFCTQHCRYYKQFRFNKPANYFVII